MVYLQIKMAKDWAKKCMIQRKQKNAKARKNEQDCKKTKTEEKYEIP